MSKMDDGSSEWISFRNIHLFNKPIRQSKVRRKESKSSSKDDESTGEMSSEGKTYNEEKCQTTMNTLDEVDQFLLDDYLHILDKTIEDEMKVKQEEPNKIVDNVKLTKVKEEISTPKKRTRRTSECISPISKKKPKLEHVDSGFDEWPKTEENPKNHDKKEYPKGGPDSLKNLTFLRTGVLDSLTLNLFESVVMQYGGRVEREVSKKVNFVVIGNQPDPAIIEKSRQYGIPKIDEHQFMFLLQLGSLPGYAKKADVQSKGVSEDLGMGGEDEERKKFDVSMEHLSWTDKYKPTNMSMIIGQQHDNSKMNRLKIWLENWFKCNAKPDIAMKSPNTRFFKHSGGEYYKAALLNGQCGVGKTTTATLVAESLGFDIIELNASDTRNGKLLGETISRMMESKPLAAFATSEILYLPIHRKIAINQKRVLVMDEVDGMADNEDKGGIAELIKCIKIAKFPIICVCNNKGLQKMRDLVNYCFVLNFERPKLAQIRGAMASISFKENIKIKPDALADLIKGNCCDIRQTLNHLALWSGVNKNSSLKTVEKGSENLLKEPSFNIWDTVRKVFNKKENKDMSLEDKARLFFYDYGLLTKFVHENYLYVKPKCTGDSSRPSLKNFEILLRHQKTAESLSRSDLIEEKCRNTNDYDLLEIDAFYSTGLPSYYMSGNLNTVKFPSWFRKNSRRSKNLRIIEEIASHARTSISGNKQAFRLDYAEPLLKKLLTPIQQKQHAGIKETAGVMASYSLLRDDLTNLCELMSELRQRKLNPLDLVTRKVKSALARTCIRQSFAPPILPKNKRGGGGDIMEDLLSEEEDESEDNFEGNPFIKVQTKVRTSKAKDSNKGNCVKKKKINLRKK